MKKFIVGFVLVALGVLMWQLQSANAIALQTLRIEATVDPGGQVASVIRLFNDQENALILYPSVEGFTDSGDETGNPTFIPIDRDVNDLPNWVLFNAEKYTIAPGEFLEVPIVIDIPINAEPGGHYATVFFGSVPSGKERGNVQLGSRIGTLVIIDVRGEVYESVDLLSFHTKEEQKMFNHLPVVFETRLENKGNVHIKPKGSIKFKNLFGMLSEEIDFNSQDGNILPNTIRKYQDVWIKDETSLENDGFWGRTKTEWNNFALGYYKAVLSVDLGRDTPNIVEMKYGFWVFPWRVLLISIILIIVLVIVLRIYNQWVLNKAYKRAKDDLKRKKRKKD